ncbi:fluoride efflux transporter FluC [Cellulomonas shaoxiangyii]|uniref:Fluoride-specific ion channel FluC n=1 Tax=Cellulomonas shaoxiangyii TaxID=2566013 RepID=A0A4P7SLR5_9CELL|nr:CrcB family protein [Cellulomonas shaoxiangyii]QCB94688.1 CrcB family protein [Cellulomonas shaoxiangyii]TGY85076.1 CrcB family protein [Cellulomonas shaoxiangyii]
MTVLLLALAGGLGAAARFVVDGLVRARTRTPFAWGTFVVNVCGSLLLGVLVGAGAAGLLAPVALLVAGTGFCGGFTTFSTAMVDSVRLAQDGDVRGAALSALGSLVVCVAAAAAGVGLVRAVTG